MDFDLTKEQKMIRDEVRNFAKKEIAPQAEELDRAGEYPYDKNLDRLSATRLPRHPVTRGRLGNLGTCSIPEDSQSYATGRRAISSRVWPRRFSGSAKPGQAPGR